MDHSLFCLKWYVRLRIGISHSSILGIVAHGLCYISSCYYYFFFFYYFLVFAYMLILVFVFTALDISLSSQEYVLPFIFLRNLLLNVIIIIIIIITTIKKMIPIPHSTVLCYVVVLYCFIFHCFILSYFYTLFIIVIIILFLFSFSIFHYCYFRLSKHRWFCVSFTIVFNICVVLISVIIIPSARSLEL